MTRATCALIDLAALRHNVAQVRHYAPTQRVMAIIKANGYGHGMVRVAQALLDSGPQGAVDAFGVASVDEAVALRVAGVGCPIVLLEGFHRAQELPLIARYQLEPVIHHPSQIDLLAAYPTPAPLSVWLKVDSGMHRLGVAPAQVAQIWGQLRALGSIGTIRLMTHLACADEPDNDYTHAQLSCFATATADLPAERAIANSAAILGWPQALNESQWVRPGLMLYGISPYAHSVGTAYGLQAVMTFMSELIAVNWVRAGEGIGYGQTWRCPEDMRVGVAAVGYGDGYPRHAAMGTPVLIGGHPAPLIGRVSMDMITVDLRHHPWAEVGEPVILWGEGLPVEHIAQAAGTIPYTLLCGVMERVRRVER